MIYIFKDKYVAFTPGTDHGTKDPGKYQHTLEAYGYLDFPGHAYGMVRAERTRDINAPRSLPRPNSRSVTATPLMMRIASPLPLPDSK